MDSNILPEVDGHVHPSSLAMTHATSLIIVFLSLAGSSAPTTQRATFPDPLVDPTEAPHFPRLTRMSTVQTMSRRGESPELPNFLRHLTPTSSDRAFQ